MSISRLLTWIIITIFGAIALYAGVFFAQRQFSNNLPDTKKIVFSLTDINGQTRSQDDWKNKVLLLNFWATWCAPCREEMPLLADFQSRYADRGLQIIGITLDDVEPVRIFADSIDINYPLLIADSSTDVLMQSYNKVGAIPFSLITDRSGKVIETKLGVFTYAELETMIKPLLD